jgi:anti-sigma regulatory factor (Ser/Thr protein kinase)
MEAAMTEALLRIGKGNKELARGLEALGAVLDAAGIGPRGRFQAELVFEELVTNVIRYGYGDEEPHLVDVAVSVDAEDVVMVVSDDGKPFNPLDRPEPDLPHSLAEAHVGGLGIMLVRKAARDVAYERRDGRNYLTVLIPRD